MIQEWEHDGFLLTVDVRPFYADVLSVTDADTGEPVPAVLFVDQLEVDARAPIAWADEQGK